MDIGHGTPRRRTPRGRSQAVCFQLPPVRGSIMQHQVTNTAHRRHLLLLLLGQHLLPSVTPHQITILILREVFMVFPLIFQECRKVTLCGVPYKKSLEGSGRVKRRWRRRRGVGGMRSRCASSRSRTEVTEPFQLGMGMRMVLEVLEGVGELGGLCLYLP